MSLIMKSTAVSAAILIGLAEQASFVSAAPTCQRVESHWAVVFTAECAEWYEAGMVGEPSAACTQSVRGDVSMEFWPWNDDVVIVNNESPGENFTAAQPEQDVTQYGAGVVIMPSTWDMSDGWVWRNSSSYAERFAAEVEYINSDEEENKYLSCTLTVEYEPPSTMSSRRLMNHDHDHDHGNEDIGAYEFGFGDEDARALQVADDPEYFFPSDQSSWNSPDVGLEPDGESSSYSYEDAYYPETFYSYEQGSYSYSYSVELTDLQSYSHSYGEEQEAEEEAQHIAPSVTLVDIYVCTDEDNTLAEIRWHCNPDDMGTAACYEEAAGPNAEALEIHGFEMYCSTTCLNGGNGGLWCDIFGLDGCRMCTTNCSALCGEGEESCSSCVKCPSAIETPAPTTAVPKTPAPTTQALAETLAPTPYHGGDFGSLAPTSAPTVDTPGGMFTASPTSVFREDEFTAAPTSDSRGGFFGTAAPTTDLGDTPFSECLPGDAQSCYDQLPPTEVGELERSGKGLTCEESCIVNGGSWCKAYGLDGCRFCQHDCDTFCEAQGLPDDCVCFEC